MDWPLWTSCGHRLKAHVENIFAQRLNICSLEHWREERIVAVNCSTVKLHKMGTARSHEPKPTVCMDWVPCCSACFQGLSTSMSGSVWVEDGNMRSKWDRKLWTESSQRLSRKQCKNLQITSVKQGHRTEKEGLGLGLLSIQILNQRCSSFGWSKNQGIGWCQQSSRKPFDLMKGVFRRERQLLTMSMDMLSSGPRWV